jgi:glycosyltransferase involved in cell wall biosynthesis
MVDSITKYDKTGNQTFDFTVLIPSWNNLDILKNCLMSIEKNSSLNIQPIVIANEGVDGTKEWLESHSVDFVHSTENLGVCYALNIARSLIKSDYVVYLNDDMYVLPNWDTVLMDEINQSPDNMFMFSGTMIEPRDTGNPCVIVKDYGNGLDNFEEEKLLSEYAELEKENWSGSTWPPNVVHINTWDLVGGLSTEFTPGMYSDPDFSMKIYNLGIRNFKGLADSRVYHFGSKSTKRVKKNLGRKMFIQKWEMSSGFFTSKYLKQGRKYEGNVSDYSPTGIERVKNWTKKFMN